MNEPIMKEIQIIQKLTECMADAKNASQLHEVYEQIELHLRNLGRMVYYVISKGGKKS